MMCTVDNNLFHLAFTDLPRALALNCAIGIHCRATIQANGCLVRSIISRYHILIFRPKVEHPKKFKCMGFLGDIKKH